MKVHRLQEFITALSNFISGLPNAAQARFRFDSYALQSFKDKFESLSPATSLSDEDVLWIKEIFSERWKNVFDTCLDYTFTIADGNEAWIALARYLSKKLNIPFLQVIIPVLTNPCDPDNYVHIKKIEDPRHVYLSDKQTWHSTHALYDKLNANPNNLSLRTSTDVAIHPLTLSPTELFRIQRKTALETAIFGSSTTFFPTLQDYIVHHIAPLWHKKDNIDVHLLALLLVLIENSYNKANDDAFDIKTEPAYIALCEYIHSRNAADVLSFYGMTVQKPDQQCFLFELLSGCVDQGPGLQERLHDLAVWIYQTDLVSAKKIPKLPTNVVTYFDIERLSNVVLNTPARIQPGFTLELDKMVQRNTRIDKRAFQKLVGILSTPWQEIIEPSDVLGKIAVMEYQSFWRFAIYRFAPAWQNSGKRQTALLTDLRDFINSYYRADNGEKILTETLTFINNLKTVAIEDVNYFYSMLVDMNGRKQYLLEILLDCLLNPNIIATALPALSKWLYKMDPSLVVEAPELDHLYQSLQGGRYFSLAALQLSVSKLSAKPGSVTAKQLRDVQELIASASGEITPALIACLRQLYAIRWNDIKDKAEDYTRLAGGTNAPWIVLAQILSGAGLILPNYYRFLIPSLTSDVDMIYTMPFTTYPLTECIVSEKGDNLIVMPHCLQNFIHRGLFYNYQSNELFGPAERQRILSSKPEYRDACLHSNEPQHNLGLSRMTVKMLTELVNDSIYANGLKAGTDLEAHEQEAAEWAYKHFWAYLQNLPEQERQDLYQHRIRLDRHERTFLEVIWLIWEKRECAATYGKYLIQLILDYKHDTVFAFSEDVNRIARVDTMRRHSQGNTYRDPERSCQAEAGRRLLTLMVSLLSHSFSSSLGFGSGHSISIGHHENKVTTTGHLLYKYLLPFIQNGEWTDAFKLYDDLLNTRVTPALDANKMTRSADTWQWLRSISNGNMFKLCERTRFEPKILLTVLYSLLAENSRLQSILRPFMTHLIKALDDNKNPLLQWIDINLEFGNCLKSVSPDQKTLILTQLRNSTQPVSLSAVQAAIAGYREMESLIGSGHMFFKIPRSDDSIPLHVLATEFGLNSSHSAGDLFEYFPGEPASSSMSLIRRP